jgi:hypothetical protein
MAITSFVARPSKNLPNLDFWLENIPSGNPGLPNCLIKKICAQDKLAYGENSRFQVST